MADILSVLALTMSEEGDRVSSFLHTSSMLSESYFGLCVHVRFVKSSVEFRRDFLYGTLCRKVCALGCRVQLEILVPGAMNMSGMQLTIASHKLKIVACMVFINSRLTPLSLDWDVCWWLP